MKLTEKEVRDVADLANLALTEAEVRKFMADLDEVLIHIGKLNEVDTRNVEPMAQVLFETEATATLRADLVRPPLGNELALENAPLAGAGYFKVPEVIKR